MNLFDVKKKRAYFLRAFIQGVRKEGLSYLRLVCAIIIGYVLTYVKEQSFSSRGKRYRYFYHPYNHTWVNERAIEIPLVVARLKEKEGSVLEIGNVLRSYFPLKHTVIDKYEQGEHIINEDAVDFKLKKKYDMIVSISTLEHVGWDEQKKDAEKIPRTIEHLRKHLSKKGKLIITVPLGYNPFLDAHISHQRIPGTISFFKRGWFGIWKEVAYPQGKNWRYDGMIAARYLAFIEINA